MKKLWIVAITLFLTSVSAGNLLAVPIPLDLGTAAFVDTSTPPVTLPDTIGATGNVNEIKLYSFMASTGDSLIADIDNGYDGSDNPGFPATPTPGLDVDLNLWLFDAVGNPLTAHGDGGSFIDPGSYETYQGSGYTFDPYLSYLISGTGLYYLAVTIEANQFVDGAFNGEGLSDLYSGGGDYTLILSGITPTSVPEPATGILLLAGMLIILGGMSRKRILLARNTVSRG
ncbi:MAG: pre-peptidase C-terminal domain-containing protein [Nitrospirae bacterium]|nr:pre-peptidase C-terminal domain-containing protein [Nitrospirota bacterium]